MPPPPPVTIQPPSLELRSLHLYLSLVQECIGSLLYVFLISSVSIPWTGHYPPFLSIAFVVGIGHAVLTKTVFKNSHLNPVFSVAEWVLGYVSGVRAGLYLVGQCGGAVAGAAVVYGLTTPGYQGTLGGTTLATNIEPIQAVFIELILSYLLVLTYLTSGGDPCIVGAVLLAGSLVATPSSGGSLNPARSLGPAFVMGRWRGHYVHWIGPLAGAIIGAYFYKYVLVKRENVKTDVEPNSDVEQQSEEEERQHGGQHPPSTRTTALAQPLHHEPLYNGTRSLYMRPSPSLPARGLNRSQSVYASRRLLEALTPAPGRRIKSGDCNTQQLLATTAPAPPTSVYEKGLLLPAPPTSSGGIDSAYFKPISVQNSCASSTLDSRHHQNNHSIDKHCHHNHSRSVSHEHHSHSHHSMSREMKGSSEHEKHSSSKSEDDKVHSHQNSFHYHPPSDVNRLQSGHELYHHHPPASSKDYSKKFDKLYEPLPPTPPAAVDRTAFNLIDSHPLKESLQPPPRFGRPMVKSPEQYSNGGPPRRPYEHLPMVQGPEKERSSHSSGGEALPNLKYGYLQLPTTSPLHSHNHAQTYSYH